MSKDIFNMVMSFFLLVFIVLNQSIFVFSNENLSINELKNFKISMNGKFYYSMDFPLFKYENEFMLTLRTCGTLINGSVEYDVALREVIFGAENRVLKIEVDSKNLFLNGEEISFPVTPITYNGRFCIPLNLLAHAFNYNVAVDYESEIIYWGFLYGDANYDGVIDSSDYVLLKRYILELSNMSNKIICDLNYDGLINSTDLAILKRLILNITTQ